MKKKITLLFLSLGLCFNSFAQNSFPTSNAIWNEVYYDENPGKTPNGYMMYGLFGDTIINELLYNKLYVLLDTTLSAESLYRYAGGFRQEEGKVFFLPANGLINMAYGIHIILRNNEEVLLYDFSANEGDTIWFYEDGGEGGIEYCIVSRIEGDVNYRVFTVVNDRLLHGKHKWHEGMGNDFGLFGHLCRIPLRGNHWETACFKHNDTAKYVNNPKCNRCFCPSVNIAEHSNSDIINIYPNPAKDILNIETTENIEIKSINIYSIDGKLIEVNKYSFNNRQLNIGQLTTGSYVISIETDKGKFSKTIIKN